MSAQEALSKAAAQVDAMRERIAAFNAGDRPMSSYANMVGDLWAASERLRLARVGARAEVVARRTAVEEGLGSLGLFLRSLGTEANR